MQGDGRTDSWWGRACRARQIRVGGRDGIGMYVGTESGKELTE